jgi:hypothetical protein
MTVESPASATRRIVLLPLPLLELLRTADSMVATTVMCARMTGVNRPLTLADTPQ